MRTLCLVALLLPVLAFAQSEVEKPAEPLPPPAPTVAPVVEIVHPAVPILPDWSIGAGIGLTIGGIGYSSLLGSVSGLAGSGGLQSLVGLGVGTQPRLTILIERRLNEKLFITFLGAASYSASQNDTNSDLKSHLLTLEATLGMRRVFNPRGLIEVSLFANGGVGYSNSEYRSLGSVYDPNTGTFSQTTLMISRGHSFSVGAVSGLALERELVSGLALRLSSSIIGLSYGLSSNTTTTPDAKTESKGHGVDVGLRFSPTIELRYAF